ncbi:MAG TPA: DUF4434 domain-containing protein [Bacillota bacterium]|nr:DUF4434 domain-containing protein [Bacillota bacterium]
MNENFCTPVPARRISAKAQVEWRVASKNCTRINITVRQNGAVVRDCGTFEITPDLALNKIVPDTNGIVGSITFVLSFLRGDTVCETIEQDYQIVSSEVCSTRLLDGCWVSILHFSPSESRYFREGLLNMTADDWRNHVRSMNKVGIKSILIQNVFDSPYYAYQHDRTVDNYDGEAFYDSALYSGRANIKCLDAIEAILSEADKYDMTVFPGVGLFAWFDFSPESLEWHKRVTKELHDKFGHHKSFYGWYISEEIMGDLYFSYQPVPDEKYKDIQDFFREYKKYVHALTPTKPVALAPNNIGFHLHEKQWLPILENLDIIIPFAFARSYYNVAKIARICAQTGTHFWVDMEMFAYPFDNGLKPKKLDEMLTEMKNYDSLEQVYGYQYTGLMNEPGFRNGLGEEDTEDLFCDYLKYYNERTAND